MRVSSFKSGSAILNYCSKFAQLLLPGVCLLCGARSRAGNLCDGCRGALPLLPRERCPCCAVPTFAGAVCGACLSEPPAFDQVVSPCAYDYPLDRVMQAFKFGGNLAAAPLFADLMLAEIVRAPRPDLIVPMPLARERLRQRGFNQSLELARAIAREIDVPLDAESCQRAIHAAPQSALAWDQRAANIRGAFVCLRDMHGCRIAVVDDVLTTGATLNELAGALKRAGAASVAGWIATRTLDRSA